MLRISNWNKHFETSDTRKLVKLHWVKLPNQHDSLPFKLIMRHERGAEIFAAWVLMVQIASKKDKDHRGNLPESPDELGIITGLSGDVFELAIDFLKSPKIGWIEQSTDNLPESPDVSGFPPENLPLIDRRNGTEYIPPGDTRGKYSDTSPEVQAIFGAYPSTRSVRGKTAPVHKTLNDYAGIAHVLNHKPDYPLMEAVRLYAKGTEAPQDLRTFLKNLPDVASLRASSSAKETGPNSHIKKLS